MKTNYKTIRTFYLSSARLFEENPSATGCYQFDLPISTLEQHFLLGTSDLNDKDCCFNLGFSVTRDQISTFMKRDNSICANMFHSKSSLGIA